MMVLMECQGDKFISGNYHHAAIDCVHTTLTLRQTATRTATCWPAVLLCRQPSTPKSDVSRLWIFHLTASCTSLPAALAPRMY